MSPLIWQIYNTNEKFSFKIQFRKTKRKRFYFQFTDCLKKIRQQFQQKTCEINSAFLALDNRATENERHI